MHACMFYIFEVKLLPGILETILIIQRCNLILLHVNGKQDLRKLNLTCKHLQLYINLYSYKNYNDLFQVARTQDRYI